MRPFFAWSMINILNKSPLFVWDVETKQGHE
jgi:hypothetical protein